MLFIYLFIYDILVCLATISGPSALPGIFPEACREAADLEGATGCLYSPGPLQNVELKGWARATLTGRYLPAMLSKFRTLEQRP